jgi:MFS family permease
MVLVGFPLLALEYTRNPASIAGVAVAGSILGPIVALPAGALADRLSPKRMLVTVELLRFALLGSFALLLAAGGGSLAAIYLTSGLLGALTVAFECASSAVVPRLVPRSLLVKANARLDIVDLAGEEVVGRAIGGIAFAFARIIPFFADAASFLASAAIIPSAVPDQPSVKEKATLLADLRSGARWFIHHPLVRLLGGVIAQLAFCQAVVLALLVLYSTEDLHLSKAGYGVLLGVSAVGDIIGALAANRVHSIFGSGWCIVLGGVVSALTYPVLAVTSSPVTACAALALEAMAIVVGNVAASALRQSIVPAEFQGRVGSAQMTLILIAAPLGALVGGLLANAIGIRHAILAAGILQLGVLVVAAPKLLSRVRTIHYPIEATEGTPATAP